jgi:hypothetical protein
MRLQDCYIRYERLEKILPRSSRWCTSIETQAPRCVPRSGIFFSPFNGAVNFLSPLVMVLWENLIPVRSLLWACIIRCREFVVKYLVSLVRYCNNYHFRKVKQWLWIKSISRSFLAFGMQPECLVLFILVEAYLSRSNWLKAMIRTLQEDHHLDIQHMGS